MPPPVSPNGAGDGSERELARTDSSAILASRHDAADPAGSRLLAHAAESLDVGLALRVARASQGLSLRELARLVHFSPGHLSKVENGRKAPSLELVTACDRVLRVTPSVTEVAIRSGRLRPPADESGTARPAPAQLPRGTSRFCGREAELTALHEIVSRGQRGASQTLPVLCLLTGGVYTGKTALALSFAHRVAHHYRDGQLYLDLGGFSSRSGALELPTALTYLLSGLGVAPGGIPESVDDRMAMYRSLIAGRSILLLLDNAARSDQVRPLLPGSGPSLVLLTSRGSLRGLVVRDGAAAVNIDYLSRDDAHRLLVELLGRRRLEKEPDATAELNSLLGGVPIAIRAVAASLADSPLTTIADYVAELRTTGILRVLSVDDDQSESLCTVFDRAYRQLDGSCRTLFHRVCQKFASTFDIESAAALGGLDVVETRYAMRELAGRQLLLVTATGQYRVSALLRDFVIHHLRPR